ncbi:hypothetical protein ACHAWF_001204 [Thalassiosira exigua]
MTSLYLQNHSDESIEIDFGLSAVDSIGKRASYYYGAKKLFWSGHDWGLRNSKRSVIKGALISGSFAQFFGAIESVDVVFEVEEEGQQSNKRKHIRRIAKFHAHQLILKQCAANLDALCGSANGMVSVSTVGVKPDIFRHIKVATDDLKLSVKELIDAADKYGVVNLKLEAEACYVKSTKFTFKNAIELLHYADSKNCTLLKKAEMDFMVENQQEVLHKVQLKDAQ